MAETADEPRKARDVTKERHRKALIEATADAILEHGLPNVSVSRILEHAGLSRGMINLHERMYDLKHLVFACLGMDMRCEILPQTHSLVFSFHTHGTKDQSRGLCSVP